MHELGMCESVLAAVEQRASGRAVDRIGVRAGAGLRVVPEAFAQGFEMVATGSVADGATAEVTIIPVEVTCRGCGESASTMDPLPACTACGGVDLERVHGDELVLEWIRYREPAPQGTS